MKTILSSLLSFILNRECTVIVKTFNLSKSYFLMFLSSLKIAGVHLADFWRKCLAVNVTIFCASIPRKTFLTVAYHNRIYDMSTSAGWNPLRSKNEKWFPLDLFVSSLLFWSFFFLMSDLHARSSNKGMKECILVPSAACESLFLLSLLLRARVD